MNLKSLREAAGMTQAQLSVASGVGMGTIQRIENGKLEATSVGNVLKLCRALGCDIASFFTKND